MALFVGTSVPAEADFGSGTLGNWQALSHGIVGNWSTAMRYVPRNYEVKEVIAFIRSADAIIAWAKGRL